MSITVTLPDGKPLELPDGATGADAAAAIGPGLARAALAVKVSVANGGAAQAQTAIGGPAAAPDTSAAGATLEMRDLARPLEDGTRIAILTARSDGEEPLRLIRHDAAHVLASAVMELYPGVKISIGPAIEQGFYYDFDFPDGVSVSEADFPVIEDRMRAHVKAAERFAREDVPVADARARFAAAGQDYKVELIDDLVRAAEGGERDAGDGDGGGGGSSARPSASVAPAGAGLPGGWVSPRGAQGPLRTVSLYTNGPFTDLCRGPHAPTTKTIGAFKLQSVAGAYWRGDSSRTMLTRIYGTAFFTKAELNAHVERLEQARARDHRKLGRELDLFQFSELSPGAPLWKPAGMVVWNALTELWREENRARGYEEVKTPILFDVELFKQSGHWDKFRENMYFTEVEGRPMGMKPMNCPAHIQIYKDVRRSYRDLPIRYSEQGLVHRHEPSGTLHGLLRVRPITQDDAHIFCTEDQVQEEVVRCLRFGFHIYELFGFEPRLELSTRPRRRIGSDAMWDRAEAALAGALKAEGLAYELNPGDGAFYGPKIDLHMTDSIGRSWQLGTVQLDYSMPERFELAYTGADNAEHRPVMIHRALLGSFERFIGILIEHYAGELPLWLAPVQAIVLSVSDRFNEYGDSVRERLRAQGLRVELDDRRESIPRKVRDAELRRVPNILVVGEREAGEGTVSVRTRSGPGEHGVREVGNASVDELTQRLAAHVRRRAPSPSPIEQNDT
ncbi:MAG TPA: threonine--tRNA ligase [Solirubrobacteraceae bacterium]|jgi:threonyl-tRNA synthetase|nr:threonine--tRNA ligase [Solirubrobacteraceae bacterium]